MNPLDFRGPQFLLFYILWSLGVLALLRMARAVWERAASPARSTGPRWAPGIYPAEVDAYAIALLRGGPAEAARALLGRLVADGYVTVDGRQLKRSEPPPDVSRLEPIEREALHSLFPPIAYAVEAQEAEKRAVQAMHERVSAMQEDLEAQGLAPPAGQWNGYKTFFALGLTAGTGLGLAKVLVGLSRGRPITFLLILMAVFAFACFKVLRPPFHTVAGGRYLAWLKESHKGLAQLIGQEKRTGRGELALATCIYGIAVLPTFKDLLTALQPPQTSGGSDGGSCGGGGCGGGCGGCGG
jgi:uncharacterized protein (TIGR04222 family)